MTRKTIIVIPAYNAENTLPTLLTETKQRWQANDILVVNDGSTDKTALVGETQGVEVLNIGRKSGKGSALTAAFARLKDREDVDAVITMDADLQHNPADIEKFLDERGRRRSSLVLGKRKRWGTSMPMERRLSNTLTSWMVSARTGIPIADSQCGFRLIGIEVLRACQIDSPGFEAETELLIKAARRGFSVSSVEIQTRYDGEKSNMTYWETTKLFVKTLLKEY